MADTLGMFLGGLLLVFLLTRLARKMLGDQKYRPPYFIGTYAITLAFCTVIGGFGFAALGEPPAYAFAFSQYVFPTFFVLLYDVYQLYRPKSG